jgi:hypothetical protein
VPAGAPTHHTGAAPQPPRTPATIKAISSNSRQNAPCPSVRVLLNGRREARDSIARPGCSTEGATHAQNTDDVFYACRQHWGTDAACQRAISKSCHARAGGRASGISAIAKYRVATNLHVSEVWRDSRKREISVWTVPLASARSRPVIAFHGVSASGAARIVGDHNRFRPASCSALPARTLGRAGLGVEPACTIPHPRSSVVPSPRFPPSPFSYFSPTQNTACSGRCPRR